MGKPGVLQATGSQRVRRDANTGGCFHGIDKGFLFLFVLATPHGLWDLFPD